MFGVYENPKYSEGQVAPAAWLCSGGAGWRTTHSQGRSICAWSAERRCGRRETTRTRTSWCSSRAGPMAMGGREEGGNGQWEDGNEVAMANGRTGRRWQWRGPRGTGSPGGGDRTRSASGF